MSSLFTDTLIPILYLSAVVNFVIAAILISRSYKSPISIIFGVITSATGIWSVAIIGFYSSDISYPIYWIGWTHLAAITVAGLFFCFTLIYPKTIVRMRYVLPAVLSSIVLIGALLFGTHFIIGATNGPTYQIGRIGYVVYAAILASYFGAGFIVLFYQWLHDEDRQSRIPILLVLLGSVSAAVPGLILDLIFPYFGIYEYTWTGPLFTILLVAALLVAIVKYHLFKVKLIITEAFSFSLIVFLAIQIFTARDVGGLLISTMVLVAVVIFSFLLIRGVYRDIEAREKIEKLADGLKKANEGQENLIHIMNHQIKGYLGKDRSIFAELLAGEYGRVPETARSFIQEGFEQSTKGIEYVQDILKGESAQKGTLPYDMKPVDIRAVVTELLPGQTETAEERGLSFESKIGEGDFRTVGDATELGEAFKNLMTNAVKYNSPHGHIWVNLASKDGTITFSVKDTGVGIADEDKPRLFTAGGVGKNSIHINAEASGYGLAFVKGVAEAHKGAVGYRSNKPEQGTTFFMELPVVRAAA